MKKIIIVFVLICCAAFFNTCGELDVVSFGSKVNTEIPVISTPEDEKGSGPGAFLRGETNIIYINVEQPFGLNEVFMTIWYTDRDGIDRERIVNASMDERGLWFVNINALEMEDGSIRAQVTAIDISGNRTTTTDMIYTVKNTPPRIELTLPKITDYDSPEMNDETEALTQGSDIMGLASDAFGIEAGYPQVLFWPADYADVDEFGIPFPSDLKYGQWRSATDGRRAPLDKDGLKAVQFRWPLVDLIENNDGTWRLPLDSEETVLSPGFYRFKIRVKDKFGITNTYPNRLDNEFGYDETDPRLNHFIHFALRASSGPIVQWYDFPQFYNGQVPFKAILRITSANEMRSIRAGIGNDENRNTVQWVNAVPLENNLYEITIPPEYVPYTSPGIKTGEKIFHVAISDDTSVTDVSRVFILDDLPPSISFIEPLGIGTNDIPRLTSSIVFRGISDDNSRVARLYYALGRTEINALDLSEAPMDMHASELEPRSGWIDTRLHAAPLDSHPGAGNINVRWGGSLYSWNWRFTDIAEVCKFPTPAVDSSGNYYVEDYDMEANLWRLPVYFKIVDAAGNVRIYKEEIIVDPDADNPAVHVSSHANGQTVGGTVRINGTASDNEMIYAVETRIFKQTDAQCGTDEAPSFPVTSGWVPVILAGNMGSTVSWLYSINSDGSLNPPQGSATRRVLLEFRAADAYLDSPNTFKQYGNTTRVLLVFDNTIPVIDNITIIHGKPSEIEGAFTENYIMGSRVAEFVTLKAAVRDNGGVTSIMLRPQGISGFTDRINSLTLNDTEPFVVPPRELKQGDSVTFGRLYYIKESNPNNNFASLQAGPPAHIPVVDEGGNFIAINDHTITGGVLIEANVPETGFIGHPQFFEYTLYIPLNTNADASQPDAILNGRYRNSAGNYDIAVQVTDNTHPVPYILNDTISLQIDNYYPFASYNGNLNAFGNYSISGRAWDTGTGINVQGIDKVVVYFSRNGTPVSLNEKGEINASWVYNQKAKQNRRGDTNTVTAEGVLNTLPFFPDVRQADGTYVTTNSGIVINTTGNSGGYQVSFTGNPVRNWSASYDATRLNDGPVTVNYVVFDTAGNASHFTQNIYVANNRPVIKTISLGTDLSADGNLTDSEPNNEYVKYTITSPLELTTSFRIRNSMFGVKIETEKGNGQKSYRVEHVTRSGPVSAHTIQKGRVYTVFDPGNINWIDYGAFERPQNNLFHGVTFTATTNYTGTGSGAVYTYTHNGNANTVKTGTLTGDLAQDVFGPASFGPFIPLITDSVNSEDGNANAVLNRNRYFIIKVYDSTIEGAAENDQLSHTIVINADVNNFDAIKPKITISPFFWNNADDNSLYKNSKAEGHIEYESDLDLSIYNQSTGIRDRDPKVSGKISIRGRAFDNNIIGNIYVNIGQFFPLMSGNISNEILSQAGISGTPYYFIVASNNGGLLQGRDSFEADGYKFSIISQTLDQSGHTVYWQMDWDSSRTVSPHAFLDINTNMFASDIRPNYSALDSYRMDIVPYITAIETNDRAGGGLKAENIRSADGKYSILHGTDLNARFITVRGFNLFHDGTLQILNERDNTAYRNNPSNVPTGQTMPWDYDSVSKSFRIPNTVPSGYFMAIINSIGTLNNINNNDARGSYVRGTSAIDQEHLPNRRADPYTTGNITLTDDVYLQFYRVQKTDVRNGYYPVMMLEEDNNGNDVVVVSYVDYTGGITGSASIGPNRFVASASSSFPQRAKFRLNDMVMLDTEFLANTSACEQMAMARDDSGRYLHVFNHANASGTFNMVYDRYAELHCAISFGTFSNAEEILGTGEAGRINSYIPHPITIVQEIAGMSNNCIPLEGVDFTPGFAALNRYQYPKVIARGNSITNYANYYLSYFDSVTRQIILRGFRIGRQGENFGGNRQLYNTLTIGNNTLQALSDRLTYCIDALGRIYNSFTNLTDPSIRITAANSATSHFDMAVDSRGRAVIVYYNENTSRLAIRYSSSSPNGFTNTDLVFIDSGANAIMPEFTGHYVSVCIDEEDRLHIAALDSVNGTLKYIFVGNFTAASAAGSNTRVVTVDQYGNVGYWTNIKLHPLSGAPYIAYYNAAETGTREPIKLAWAKMNFTNALEVKGGVDNNGYTTGDWEYRTIPALDPPQGGTPRFRQVNLDFLKNGDPILGYLGSNIEFSYPVREN